MVWSRPSSYAGLERLPEVSRSSCLRVGNAERYLCAHARSTRIRGRGIARVLQQNCVRTSGYGAQRNIRCDQDGVVKDLAVRHIGFEVVIDVDVPVFVGLVWLVAERMAGAWAAHFRMADHRA
jgi:hypothetical protein